MIFETWISKPRNSTVHWLWRDCTTWLWRGMTQKPSQSRLGLGKRFQLVFNQYFMSFHRYINTLYHRYEAIFSGALVLLHGDFWRGKATKRPSPSRLPVKVYYWVYHNILLLVGGLDHFLFFHILGISSSQLTETTSRHQPSPTVTNRHQPSPTVTNRHQPSPTVTNRHQPVFSHFSEG